MIDPKILEQELNGLPPGWIVLLETSPENAMEANLASIKFLTGRGYQGIILSASRPYPNLVEIYKRAGVDIDRLFFIDCLCKSQGMDLPDVDNAVFLDNVSDLSNISISIKSALDAMEGSRFVFIDSITTMLIHHDPAVFARFIHGILTRLRVLGVNGMLVSLETQTDQEVRAEIAQLCDKVIKL